MSTSKRMHDALIAQMPEGATHDASSCRFCAAHESGMPEGDPVETYTAEEVQEAVDSAIATLTARIAAMETAATESETAARIDAFKADAEAQIAEVREQLDTAVLEAEQAKSELDTFKAELAELAEAEALAASIESRRDERLARVKEVASFPDEYLTLNADRFAAMSDEAFEEKVAEWAMISAKSPATAGGVPTKTALAAFREVASNNDSGRVAMREVMQGFRANHIDPRSL